MVILTSPLLHPASFWPGTTADGEEYYSLPQLPPDDDPGPATTTLAMLTQNPAGGGSPAGHHAAAGRVARTTLEDLMEQQASERRGPDLFGPESLQALRSSAGGARIGGVGEGGAIRGLRFESWLV